MPLLTLSEALAFAGITTSDPTRDAVLSAMIAEAIDAVKRYLNNGEIEQTQYTVILDLPTYPSIVLPYFPVTYAPSADPAINFQMWINPNANGDPSLFTDPDFLLTPYRDYYLDMGQANITTSQSGIVRFVNGSAFFASYERPLYSLAVKAVPTRGAVKVVYTAGYATVPPAIKGALNLIVRKLFNSRKYGGPYASESLVGYSYSLQGNANGILWGDPTIRQMLATFARPQVGSYA